MNYNLQRAFGVDIISMSHIFYEFIRYIRAYRYVQCAIVHACSKLESWLLLAKRILQTTAWKLNGLPKLIFVLYLLILDFQNQIETIRRESYRDNSMNSKQMGHTIFFLASHSKQKLSNESSQNFRPWRLLVGLKIFSVNNTKGRAENRQTNNIIVFEEFKHVFDKKNDKNIEIQLHITNIRQTIGNSS